MYRPTRKRGCTVDESTRLPSSLGHHNAETGCKTSQHPHPYHPRRNNLSEEESEEEDEEESCFENLAPEEGKRTRSDLLEANPDTRTILEKASREAYVSDKYTHEMLKRRFIHLTTITFVLLLLPLTMVSPDTSTMLPAYVSDPHTREREREREREKDCHIHFAE